MEDLIEIICFAGLACFIMVIGQADWDVVLLA